MTLENDPPPLPRPPPSPHLTPSFSAPASSHYELPVLPLSSPRHSLPSNTFHDAFNPVSNPIPLLSSSPQLTINPTDHLGFPSSACAVSSQSVSTSSSLPGSPLPAANAVGSAPLLPSHSDTVGAIAAGSHPGYTSIPTWTGLPGTGLNGINQSSPWLGLVPNPVTSVSPWCFSNGSAYQVGPFLHPLQLPNNPWPHPHANTVDCQQSGSQRPNAVTSSHHAHAANSSSDSGFFNGTSLSPLSPLLNGMIGCNPLVGTSSMDQLKATPTSIETNTPPIRQIVAEKTSLELMEMDKDRAAPKDAMIDSGIQHEILTAIKAVVQDSIAENLMGFHKGQFQTPDNLDVHHQFSQSPPLHQPNLNSQPPPTKSINCFPPFTYLPSSYSTQSATRPHPNSSTLRKSKSASNLLNGLNSDSRLTQLLAPTLSVPSNSNLVNQPLLPATPFSATTPSPPLLPNPNHPPTNKTQPTTYAAMLSSQPLVGKPHTPFGPVRLPQSLPSPTWKGGTPHLEIPKTMI